MIEIDNDMERSVKEFLSRGLSGAKPTVSVRDFCAEPKVRRQKLLSQRLRPLAAVLALACMVFSLMKIPAVGRAFASVPLLGDAYVSFLKQVNLDAAYQAGLLTRLDRTMTKDGLTLAIIDAGVDGDEIVVSYSLSPTEEDGPDGAWTRMTRGEILLAVHVGGGGTRASLQTPGPDEDRVYGVVRADKPKGLWSLVGAKITLSVDAHEKEPYFDPPFDQDAWKAGRLLYSWEMSVPVRAVEVEPTVVPINKELVAGKDVITLEQLVFTPWRTVLKYTVRNAQRGDRPDRLYWQSLGDCLSMLTSEGRPVYLIGGPPPEGWGFEEIGHGEAHFQAVQGQDLAIIFKTPRFEPDTLELPLEENATTSCLDGEGSLKVETVNNLEGGLEVTIRLESDLKLQDAWVQLVDGQGRSAKMAPFVRFGRGNTVQFSFVTNLDSGPYHLEVSRLLALEQPGTTVLEVKGTGN